MSRSYNKHKSGYNPVKRMVKDASKINSRNETKTKLNKIMNDVELADEIIFNRYQDTNDRCFFD